MSKEKKSLLLVFNNHLSKWIKQNGMRKENKSLLLFNYYCLWIPGKNFSYCENFLDSVSLHTFV